MLKITKADIKQTKQVITHYKTVIKQIKNNDFTPGWEFGIHPTQYQIKNAIKNGELYIGKIGSEIVASLILDHNPLESNNMIQWTYNLKDHETYFIHLIAVNQEYKNMGIAKQMIKYTFKIAKEHSIKSIRLSLNSTNLTIKNIYLKTGFKYMGKSQVYIEKRGNLIFHLFEKII